MPKITRKHLQLIKLHESSTKNNNVNHVEPVNKTDQQIAD